jgi:hypothetical protein
MVGGWQTWVLLTLSRFGFIDFEAALPLLIGVCVCLLDGWIRDCCL